MKKPVPETAKIIGKNLMDLRHMAGLSRTALEPVLQASFQQIAKYESGANRLPIEMLYTLKHYYNVPFERFFIGIDDDLFIKTMPVRHSGTAFRAYAHMLHLSHQDAHMRLYKVISALTE